MIEDVVKAARHDVEAGVGGAGIGRAERVKLLDRPVRVDHDQRARQQPEPLHFAGIPEDKLDKLAEQPDSRLLPRRAVPAFEHADKPVRVLVLLARRARRMVRVRQQQVKGRRGELEQRLVRLNRLVLDIDRAQDPAVAVRELWRPQQVKAVGHRVEAVAAIGVQPVAPRRLGVTVQADAYLDAEALERGEHRPVEQGPVRLKGHVHLGGHARAKPIDQVSQPLRPREQRLAAVQDDVHAREAVLVGVLGNALDGFADHRRAHPLRQSPPPLICHFIDITV